MQYLKKYNSLLSYIRIPEHKLCFEGVRELYISVEQDKIGPYHIKTRLLSKCHDHIISS